MKIYGYRTNNQNQRVLTEIYDMHEATYTGKDMGERKIDATIKESEPIDFQVGDYVEIEMADLRGGASNHFERFYIQTPASIKKTASKDSVADAFEHNITFFPAQYELGVTQMRDVVQEEANQPAQSTAKNIIYTGYDEFSFFGGAHLLMRRIIYVLNARFKDIEGIGTGDPDGITEAEAESATGWNYVLADSVDEEKNDSLESVQFDFSGNTVADALAKLNTEGGLNVDYFINNRIIYVGFKRPHIMQVNGTQISTTDIFNFKYGKTSHLLGVPDSGYAQKGGLYDITKTIGTNSPITRLYAYGANRNLNRFYCSDRIRKGRYVSQLMLPSFMNDGLTDYIESESGIKKFGVRECVKRWDDIYPTIKYINYGTLREIKYMFRIENSGLNGVTGDYTSNIATIRCYKVEECANHVNKLTPSYPPTPTAIFVHATGKTVKCVMWTSLSEQRAHDGQNNIPTDSFDRTITGSCFCVHHLYIGNDTPPSSGRGYSEAEYQAGGETYKCTSRAQWFTNLDQNNNLTDEQKTEVELHQIQYTDDYWGNDLFTLTLKTNSNAEYQFDEQTVFTRDGISFGCYPMVSENYEHTEGGQQVKASDATLINELVAVQPITKVDTDINLELDTQSHFYIYMKDIGFKINQQAYSGQYNWLVQDEFKVSFLDGYMGGLEFAVTADTRNDDNIVPAYLEDGTYNQSGWENPNDTELDRQIALDALSKGACWRLKCVRNTDNEYSILPNSVLNPQAGDHVVFLNIYMPDIYILAAQNRLLKEAQKYLNLNDNGDISYAMTFDKVRMAQQPKLGIQLREGCEMRIVDDDLQIYTDNEERYLYNNYSGERTSNNKEELSAYYIKHKDYFTFNANKHYTVKVEVYGSPYYYDPGNIIKQGFIKLFTKLDNTGAEYQPTITSLTVEDGLTRSYISGNKIVTVEFDTINNFNTNYEYIVGFLFNAKPNHTSHSIWLHSIRESNTAATGELAKYVDLTVDQLTIKLTDSERSYSTGNNNARRAGGTHSNGSLTKEISAVVKEKQKASAWNVLMNNVEEVTIESNLNGKTAEQAAEQARRNYKQLDSLRNNIFDPDGNVNEVFFRTMMLQVGADSMNYVLDKTYIYNGKLLNVSLTKVNGSWKFEVGYDVLRHYTKDKNWKMNSQTISGISNNVNYIAIKCSKNGNEGTWVISETQHAVEEANEPNYYFFNYGMISACESTDTTRFITETRGNVFIYGDNVVLGRIATMDGTSYMDMMRKEFKLGEGLGYKNGYLVVGSGAIFGTQGKTIDEVIADIQNQKTIGQTINEAAQKAYDDATDYADVIKSDLQEQIDGVIDSYFLKGTPTNVVYNSTTQKYDRPTTEPMLSWVVDYEKELGTIVSGVLVPKNWNDMTFAEQYTLFDRHLGDTYTNVNQYSAISAQEWEEGNLGTAQGTYKGHNYEYCKIGGTTDNLWIRAKNLINNVPGGSFVIDSDTQEYRIVALHFGYLGGSDTLVYLGTYSQTAKGKKLENFPAKNANNITIEKIGLKVARMNGNSIVDTPLTDAEKFSNINDSNAGKSWRWCEFEDQAKTTYHWHEIADSDAVLALQRAAEAQDTADGKRRVFTQVPPNHPSVPYDKGDLWSQGSNDNEDLMCCVNTKAANQTYEASDWAPASSALKEAQKKIGQGNMIGETNPFVVEAVRSSAHPETPVNYKWSIIVGNINNTYKAVNETKLVAGKTYVFACDKTIVNAYTSQAPTKFSLRLYDGTTVKYVGDLDISNQRVTKTFTVDSGYSNGASLIVYAGVAGATDGNKLTFYNLLLQEGEKASSYVDYMQYLAEAFENKARAGQTVIDGGLLMTDVIQLSNGTSIQAGMSGITEDTQGNPENVLLWGGGSYANALNASLHDYHKTGTSGNNLIQTLIKKDGTGKIGIFRINSSDIEVRNTDGTRIVISPDDGITMYDTNGKIKATYRPYPISSFEPLDDSIVEENKTMAYSGINKDLTFGSVSFEGNIIINEDPVSIGTQNFPYGTSTVHENEYDIITTITNTKSSVNVSTAKISGVIARITTIGETISQTMTVQLKFELYIGNNLIGQAVDNLNITGTNTRYEFTNRPLSFILDYTKLPNLNGNIEAHYKITATVNIGTGVGNLNINACHINFYSASQSIGYKKTTETKYSYISRTAIGTNGIISMIGNKTYFEILNVDNNNPDNRKQKIITKGLPTSSTGLVSGQMWNDNGTLKIKP